MAVNHRIVEVVGIAGFTALELWLCYRLVDAVDSAAAGVVLAFAIAVGYVGADFFSGFVHWLFDRYGTVDTPVFGPNFIRPFREHHVDPKGITRHDFIETNGNNCIATAPVLAIGLWLPHDTDLGLLVGGLCASLALFVFATNQFHKWAHADSTPGWVKLLQRAGLILAPDHHDVHHSAPFDRYYCITTGWLNPVLSWLRFFARIESSILRLTGVRAGADDAVHTGLPLPDLVPEPETTADDDEAGLPVRAPSGLR